MNSERSGGEYGSVPPNVEPYLSYRSCRAFLERTVKHLKTFSIVGKEGSWGLRFRFGPMCFEEYHGGAEPEIDPSGPLRKVTWQPVVPTDASPLWRASHWNSMVKRNGYAVLNPSVPYEASWTPHAQRHLKRWRKERLSEWEIIEVPPSTFIAAYKKAKMDWLLKNLFADFLRKKVRAHGTLIHCFVARRKQPNARIEAGLAVMDVPECKESLHVISFIYPSARRTSVGVGLIDEWFLHGLKRGLTYLNFGVYWMSGSPGEWKGFSQFKSQFGIHYIDFPPPYVRWAGSLRETFTRKKKTA